MPKSVLSDWDIVTCFTSDTYSIIVSPFQALDSLHRVKTTRLIVDCIPRWTVGAMFRSLSHNDINILQKIRIAPAYIKAKVIHLRFPLIFTSWTYYIIFSITIIKILPCIPIYFFIQKFLLTILGLLLHPERKLFAYKF